MLDYGVPPRSRAWLAHRPWIRAGLLRGLEVTLIFTSVALWKTFFPGSARFDRRPLPPFTRSEWIVVAVHCILSTAFCFAHAYVEHRWGKERATLLVIIGVPLILGAGIYLLMWGINFD